MNHEVTRRESLVRRVNELYHDLQSREFDIVHRHRHRVEQTFWQREVAPRLAASGAAHGVDLCTGTGYVPGVLLRLLPAARCVRCFDISAGALEEARRRLARYADRVAFDTADAASLPLADESADWVSMNAALHHMPDPDAVLREVDRVLKSGGVFCLGYEPNSRFFASKLLVAMERGIWHAFWYGSPMRNWTRIRRILRPGTKTPTCHDVDHLAAINATLLAEGHVATPLTLDELRSVVDLHTHADECDVHKRGFDPQVLIQTAFPGYEVLALLHSDYGGEMLRKLPWLRAPFDALMRFLAPDRGRLFSWILRKPGEEEAGR